MVQEGVVGEREARTRPGCSASRRVHSIYSPFPRSHNRCIPDSHPQRRNHKHTLGPQFVCLFDNPRLQTPADHGPG